MKRNTKTILMAALLFFSVAAMAQNTDNNSEFNAAESLLNSGSNLSIGGYAQIDYNQPFVGGERRNSTLDIHRLVLLFGYRFNEKTSFVSEIELEHVQEVGIASDIQLARTLHAHTSVPEQPRQDTVDYRGTDLALYIVTYNR